MIFLLAPAWALADNHDVIFVPDTGAAQIKDKLENLTIGIVMMHGDAAKESGLVDGWNGSVGDEIGILDASHYITSAFTSTSVPIYDGNMDGVSGSGAMAPDLEVLATWNGAPGVAVLERGKATTGGVSPGRRATIASFSLSRVTGSRTPHPPGRTPAGTSLDRMGPGPEVARSDGFGAIRRWRRRAADRRGNCQDDPVRGNGVCG